MNGVDTPNIQNRVKELQQEIRPYSTTKEKSTRLSIPSLGKKIYIIVPVAVLVVLIIWRPGFLYQDVLNNGEQTRKLSFKKLLLTWLVSCSLIAVAFYTYKYKTKTK